MLSSTGINIPQLHHSLLTFSDICPFESIQEQTGECGADEADEKWYYSVQHLKALYRAATAADSDALFRPFQTDKDETRSLIPADLFSHLTAAQDISSLLDPATISSVRDQDQALGQFMIAIILLHAFVQQNFTGPDLAKSAEQILQQMLPHLCRSSSSSADAIQQSSSEEQQEINTLATQALMLAGEPAYHLSQHPILLLLSLHLFASLSKSSSRTSEQSMILRDALPFWSVRAAMVHQALLSEPVPFADPSSLEAVDRMLSAGSPSEMLQERPDLFAQLLLERVIVHHHFQELTQIPPLIERARRLRNFNYRLTGVLGKRTKFQEHEIAQSVLLAKSSESSERRQSAQTGSDQTTSLTSSVPTALALNDDVLLEKPVFSQAVNAADGMVHQTEDPLQKVVPGQQPVLAAIDQCLLLDLTDNIRASSSKDLQTNIEIQAYVERILENPSNWTVYSLALLQRCRLEADRTRTVERSVLQMQALVDQIASSDSSPLERLRYVYCVHLPSKWQMQRELAQRYRSVGLTRSALEVYQLLEMFEDVVLCLQSLGQDREAIELVQSLLSGKKTESDQVLLQNKSSRSKISINRADHARLAKYWCLLGDLQPAEAASHYQHAWDVSGHSSSRAMRSLAFMHYAEQRWQDAIDCLQSALKINPLFSRSWFLLGCNAIKVENWQVAVEAFTRCVAMDADDAESWNNLASVHLRLSEAVSAKVRHFLYLHGVEILSYVAKIDSVRRQ